jgi:molecular chaperone DnaK (HSP70)
MKFGALLLLIALAGCKKDAGPPALGEAISVEQPGGTVSQLFTQGSEIPTSATESFTTGRDDETRIFIHVLRGAGKTAKTLPSDGWYSVDGLSPMKAGDPRVMVTFEVDAQGKLGLTARSDEKRLAVKKVEKPEKIAAAPLTEPDDDDDADDDTE